MPDNALQTPPPQGRLPRWFVRARSVILGLYLGVIALCIAGVFLIGFGGMIVYRDFSNYSLAGNPWEPSSFPGYVIWPMRLMSIVGVMIAVGGGFAIVDALVLRLGGRGGPAAGAGRRVIAAAITFGLELALTAWLMRWI